MNARTSLILATPCFLVMLAHASWAQQTSDLALESDVSYSDAGAEYRYYDHRQWIANLQKAGFINRSLPKPYRVAIPLMSFGDAGPKIMFTYGKNMSDNGGGRGLLLFITVEIP